MHSWWTHPRWQLTELFSEGRFHPWGFCKDGEVFKRSCALWWVSTSSGCSASALLPAGKFLSVRAERDLSSFSGWSPFTGWMFPLSRATFTLINWKLSSFGPLGFRVLPPKRQLFWQKKKRDGSCLSAELFGQVPPLNCRIVIWKEKETLRARLGCRLPSCVPRPEEIIYRGTGEPESIPLKMLDGDMHRNRQRQCWSSWSWDLPLGSRSAASAHSGALLSLLELGIQLRGFLLCGCTLSSFWDSWQLTAPINLVALPLPPEPPGLRCFHPFLVTVAPGVQDSGVRRSNR